MRMVQRKGALRLGKGMESAVPGEEWLPMGYFSKLHGLKGGLFLKTPDRRRELGDYPRLLVVRGAEMQECAIVRSYVSANEPVVVLEGVGTREAAEPFLSAEVYVNREDIPEDEQDDALLVADLLGLKVLVEGRGEIGEVVGVVDFGAQENLEIRLSASDTVAYYPFIEEYILDVSLDEQTISIVYLPEFLEET